jgi:hypothetical protein
MSVDQPLYGVDISDYQRGLDLAQVEREGYEFCVVKASEGPYRDGTSYLNPSYGPQIDAAQRAGLLPGRTTSWSRRPPGRRWTCSWRPWAMCRASWLWWTTKATPTSRR